MRRLTMITNEDLFDNMTEEIISADTDSSNNTVVISSDDLLSEVGEKYHAEKHEIAFFMALYYMVMRPLSHRADVILDCSRITEEEQNMLIRALNNTSGLEMLKQEEVREGVTVYLSR